MTIEELEKCIDSYGRDIYGFCRQITKTPQDGDDLYQDTFLKAVELKDKIDAYQNPKSYLISITIRLWKNRQRKYAWRKRIAGTEVLVEENAKEDDIRQEDSADSPEQLLLKKEEALFVQECVRRLDEKHRLPLSLYYSAELSVREIAEVLRLPEGTVKSRLHHARRIMKEQMEVAGYDR